MYVTPGQLLFKGNLLWSRGCPLNRCSTEKLKCFLLRNVMGETQGLQTTIPFPVMMVNHAPEMTAATVANVLVHRSHAFHVNIVIMTHVV